MRFVTTALLSLVILATTSCADFVRPRARCARLDARIRDCFGEGIEPVLCDALSDRDVDDLERILADDRCSFLREAFPLDGDYRSATCRATGGGCAGAPLASPPRRTTRYPIVLVNGIDSSPLFRYSERIVSVLGERDQVVRLATLPSYEASRVRAAALWTRINEVRAETGAARVNLVCHSLGGLDCRYLVSPGGLRWDLSVAPDVTASVVASVTTVATAHHGTPIADLALGTIPPDDVATHLSPDDVVRFVSNALRPGDPVERTQVRAALLALTSAQAAAFNAEITDAPGVYYQSWAGFSRPFGSATPEHDARVRTECAASDGTDGLALYRGDHDFMSTLLSPMVDVVGRGSQIDDHDEPHDGLCPVASARWGRFRGCVPADHMEQLGQRNLPDVNVRTRVDIAQFYAAIASDLAAQGF